MQGPHVKHRSAGACISAACIGDPSPPLTAGAGVLPVDESHLARLPLDARRAPLGQVGYVVNQCCQVTGTGQSRRGPAKRSGT